MIRIGMLTSGGDCQALNAAMRGVAKTLYNSSEDVEIYGFLDGYQGLIRGKFRLLTYNDFSGILTKGSENVFFGGQITGVEGYVESAASGIIAGRALADRLLGKEPLKLPNTTMLGAIIDYVCDWSEGGDYIDFDPMGANMGILPPLDENIRDKREKYAALAKRALGDLDKAIEEN